MVEITRLSATGFRIEALRESDPEVDALLSDLKRRLGVISEDEDGDSDSTDTAAVSKITLASVDLTTLAELASVVRH